MGNKYIIEGNEDNSFNVRNYNEFNVSISTETKDLVSFSLQYLYTVLNPDSMVLSNSAKDQVVSVIDSFDFNKDDVKLLSDLICKIGDKMNKSLMVYENDVPKNWGDVV
jgi:hypothetical protein